MSEAIPFVCEPVFVEKIWGGHALHERLGKRVPDPSARYGESWEVADLPEGASSCGAESLTARAERLGEALLGEGSEGRFPLLVKVLDAQRDLSVQVHPGHSDLARVPAGARSKDECWIILDAEPGACVLHGAAPGASAEALRAACGGDGDPIDQLRRVPVAPGDVLRVPPGTLHAICAGVVLLEIQEPSDTTYRVWDYERPGLDGLPRALHLEEAMTVANFGDQPPAKLEPEQRGHAEVLVRAPSYRVERAALDAPVTLPRDARAPRIVFALDAPVTLDWGEGALTLERARTAVVPAACGDVVMSSEAPGARVVVASPQDVDIL